MTQEATPGSVAYDDNLRITLTPSASDPLSAAILNGGTAKDLTYSFTPDGWNFPKAETEIPDPRLTLLDSGSVPGRTKFGPIEVKYVFGSGADVAKAALVQGTIVNITLRDSLPNATAWTAAQTASEVVKVRCGRQRRDSATADGLQTISQTLYVVSGSYQADETIVT